MLLPHLCSFFCPRVGIHSEVSVEALGEVQFVGSRVLARASGSVSLTGRVACRAQTPLYASVS